MGITSPHGAPARGFSRAAGAGVALPGLRLVGKGLDVGSLLTFLREALPSSLFLPGYRRSLYLLMETWGSSLVQEAVVCDG